MSKVSVLVPTYNRVKYISECIDSLISQTVPLYQIIVIDDGSDDQTHRVLENYNSRITVLRKVNGGKSSAINFGMKYVSGDYVWIFDDDDVALPNSVERRLKILQDRPELGFVFSSHYHGSDSSNGRIKCGERYYIKQLNESEILSQLLKGYFFTLQGVLARTECYRTVGEFDETLFRSQDYEMMIRLARHFFCTGLNEPTFIFRHHAGQRGPSGHRHSNQSRNSVWLTYDQMIGRRIRSECSLDEFIPKHDSLKGNDLKKREALLRRMSVMSSKGLIDEMLNDLKSALENQENVPLTYLEKEICYEAVCHTYFLMMLPKKMDVFFIQLNSISKRKIGYQVVFSFARGFFWLSRSRDCSLNLRILHLFTAIKMVILKFL